jgi:hypothetical protein
MKAVLLCAVLGFFALTGCQTSQSDPLDLAARRQAAPLRIEFTRGARIYEDGDAIFAMMNDTRQVFWFPGYGPESPGYQLTAGAATTRAPSSQAGVPPDRIPLSPGETRYFEIKTANLTAPISVGVTFYPSRTGTNGTAIWSIPATVPPKQLMQAP